MMTRVLALLTFCSLLVPSPARAEDADDEAECRWAAPVFGESGYLWAEWTYSGEGELLPELLLYAVDTEGLRYKVRLRVHYENEDVFWTYRTEELEPSEVVGIPVEVPGEAFVSESQLDYLSDVSVLVVAIDAEGRERQHRAASRLRLAYEAPDLPLLLDTETAAELAPGDAWNPEAAPRAGTFTPEEAP